MLRLKREKILSLARDVPFASDVLRSHAHMETIKGISQTILSDDEQSPLGQSYLDLVGEREFNRKREKKEARHKLTAKQNSEEKDKFTFYYTTDFLQIFNVSNLDNCVF